VVRRISNSRRASFSLTINGYKTDFYDRQGIYQGDAKAQYNLGVMYRDGEGVRQDYKKAIEWTEKAAKQGYVSAQYNLGVMYDNGQGVRQDYKKAKEWYEKAANQGDVDAQYNLGIMYDNGEGVKQDKKIAKEWFGKACDGGYQKGCDEYKKLNQQGY
jgi:TPR repeat protein